MNIRLAFRCVCFNGERALRRRPQMFHDLWQKQLHLASVPMVDGRIGAGN